MKLDSSLSAVVTGGASGLGAATVRMLVSHGVKVAIFDFNAEQGEAMAKEVGGVFCQVDVTKEEQVDAAFAKARAANGQERILVNCAGIGPAYKTAGRDRKTGAITHFPIDKFAQTIQVNLIGSFRCAAKSAAGMLTLDTLQDEFVSGERGVIVNTASVAAQDGQIGQAAYSASKGGILGMTLPMARDLMGDGIRVNTIMPGIFETPLLLALPTNVLEALGQSVPFPKRLGKPAEYAAMVSTIVTNSYLNGESIRLDGAIRMAPR
ncbi:SDR family NAD(P)-dependent oxidoreductase [Hydrogenophaga sp. H7]|uniref:SDR family NAD(P)-dependent oxidoreductase n=1 Tax=Hydrogenophaga sp. H7 TaxID=1882399 RepID=UPI0009A278CD|nr:SDR family NAD(P)-dependent oxidoreductase [Hydrogenophaga sp. H7]OPF61959.1 3-hydroxy-2-methylbutyryl-CoA dehydrogenase [Hydrogenophaga sp. H7]